MKKLISLLFVINIAFSAQNHKNQVDLLAIEPRNELVKALYYATIDETFKVDKEFFLESVNSVRAEGCNCRPPFFHSTTPLRWNDTLAMAAKAHSMDMDAKKFFRHRGSDGSNHVTRAIRQGYNSKNVGENIYHGGRNDQRAFEAWMESPSHCANIMNPQFTEIGVAREGDYWTMVLGRPKR